MPAVYPEGGATAVEIFGGVSVEGIEAGRPLVEVEPVRRIGSTRPGGPCQVQPLGGIGVGGDPEFAAVAGIDMPDGGFEVAVVIEPVLVLTNGG